MDRKSSFILSGSLISRAVSRDSPMTQNDSSAYAYLPVTTFMDRLGLYVTGVGHDVVPPKATYPRQKHPELYDFSWAKGRILPEFQFVFIADGEGEFESEATGLQEVNAGTILILFPDVWHRYRPKKETGWEEYWVALGGDLLFQWRERGLFSVDRPLTALDQPLATEEDYRRLFEMALLSREQDALRLTACVMNIFAGALSCDYARDLPDTNTPPPTATPAKTSKPVDDEVGQAQRIIWSHSHQRVTIDMIAKKVCLNRRTLERRFKQQLGKTLLEELVSCRIQRAKRLLRETHVPIKYVAYAAGFSSLSNLCKVFRREVEMTPGEFRESVTRS